MIIVTGTLAYDYIMDFPGSFSDHILPEKLHAPDVVGMALGSDTHRGQAPSVLNVRIEINPIVFKRQLRHKTQDVHSPIRFVS